MDFGSAVIETINNSNLEKIKVKTFGYDDCFVEHGDVKEIEEKYKINSQDIINKVKK